ncbi:MAG: hypothetical protein V3W14_10860 [Candidatus Neomarinimicrobiota bacterium]
MKIKINYVSDAGILKDERLVLEAIGDDDIGSYIIADSTYTSGTTISNKLRHTYWIPDKQVSKGDIIVIYTKKGQNKSRPNDAGGETHFFYWGLERTVWNMGHDVATIFKIAEWEWKKVE